MSRLTLTLALTATLAVAACGPPRTEPRTTIVSGGPRVLFEDDLRAPRNWPAATGSICKASYGDGGYIVAPPSRHISGRHYEISVDHHPDDMPLAELPGWLAQMLATPAKPTDCTAAMPELAQAGCRGCR